ncbi:hypothetical protein CA850_01140 [Micromonospora echinospora]|uniref:4-amino-4-deoxy-L-arabinose transferase-like glycosyltransferase n=1 Tax=Micromonospora echinospora TaxID=1877 RepID=A0A1C4Y799_MICEC|nr:hypothetical protein [Micromonospora echinospora]OZV84490.1 hypothetical protein CA850_01140 [Micromonospora echinospora]SCF16496.1 hypothetical protein GA0070618_3649 [Micromonospora echinospora]
MTALATGTPPGVAPTRRPVALRVAPPLAGYAVVAAVLLVTGTPALDLARFTGYALFGVLLPGTLVYRALRARPHTLVEDLAVGAAVGLVLELAGWAVFTGLGVPHLLWLWPLAVVTPFVAVPRLRRHWRVTGYTPVPAGWAWSLTAVVAGFTWYLAESFLRPNPVLPTSEGQAQYIDLAFQLSLAGAATHQMPPEVPQVAGEPLHYHWFGFAHLAAASLVSGVDLPTVFFRLAVPALCALAAVLVAVVGWRVSGRAYVGVGAAALMFTVGEFGYENGVRQLFGTQATFIVWGSPSMTYSWVLLLPLVAALADVVGRARGSAVPPLGRGGWVLATLFLVASTGAKASSVPVALGALGFTALVLLVTRRRVPRPLLGAIGLTLAAQLFATAVLFRFVSHGVTVDPFSGLRPYVPSSGSVTALFWVAVTVAFLLNLQLRLAGVLALVGVRRGRLEPVQLLLLGGALAGPAIYLLVGHPGSSNQYFVRAGFAFGVVLSAWGYAEVLDRAALSPRARVALAAGAAGLALLFTVIQLRHPATAEAGTAYGPVLPLLRWAVALAVVATVLGLLWPALVGGWPALAGRGAAVLLTGVLVAGAPGLVLDAAAARRFPNGGAYAVVPMPASRVEAARWVHRHSAPDDVLATNVHCRVVTDGWCDARSFWLSGYAGRAVLVEGWSFAPRMVGRPGGAYAPFWDPERLDANDAAFTAPTAAGLTNLRDRYGVRWLVLDRAVTPEPSALADLADERFRNDRMSVYRLR